MSQQIIIDLPPRLAKSLKACTEAQRQALEQRLRELITREVRRAREADLGAALTLLRENVQSNSPISAAEYVDDMQSIGHDPQLDIDLAVHLPA